MLVNATSVGLHGEAEQDALRQLRLEGYEAATVLDLVYGAEPTALARWAAERGSRVVDGLEVLACQGARRSSAGPAARRRSTPCFAPPGVIPSRKSPGRINVQPPAADIEGNGGPAPSSSSPYGHRAARRDFHGDDQHAPEGHRHGLRAGARAAAGSDAARAEPGHGRRAGRVLQAIWSPGKPIESAEFDIRLNLQELGGKRQRGATRITGSFEKGQAGKLPSFNLKTSEVENGKATHNHVVSTGDAGYLFNGTGLTAFALSKKYVSNVTKNREAIADGKGKLIGPDIPSFVERPKVTKNNIELDGVKTSHVVGTLSSKELAGYVSRTAKVVRGNTQAELPSHLKVKVRNALKTARIEAWVGTEDRVLRRLSIDVRGKFPKEMLDKGDTPRWHMGLDVNLTKGQPAAEHQEAPDCGSGARRGRPSARSRPGPPRDLCSRLPLTPTRPQASWRRPAR